MGLLVITLLSPFFLGSFSDAFSITPVRSKFGHSSCRGIISPSHVCTSTNTRSILHRPARAVHDYLRSPSDSSTTSRSMYNLPPSGGGSGGGGGKNDLAEIAKSALSILAVVGFFISPLGGIVLGIFNSFLVLLFVLPLVATVGFQVWQSLNTVQGTCPNCGAPATVMKNKNIGNVVADTPAPQSLCFNCGAILQANDDNTGINNVSGRKSIDDLDSPGGPSIFDLFSGTAPTTESWVDSTTTTTTTSSKSKSNDNGIDKSSVIDVDVE